MILRSLKEAYKGLKNLEDNIAYNKLRKNIPITKTFKFVGVIAIEDGKR